MEMIGLVVIVILISLGMLFVAQFALSGSPQKKVFTRKGLAYSTMSAMMKTSISTQESCALGFVGEVRPQIGKDLLEDCAKNCFTAPEGYSLYQCKGDCGGRLHSCLFLQEKMQFFLNQTLGQWNKRYEFESVLLEPSGQYKQKLLQINSSRGNCPSNRERDTSGLFPINTEAGLVENVLYLCD